MKVIFAVVKYLKQLQRKSEAPTGFEPMTSHKKISIGNERRERQKGRKERRMKGRGEESWEGRREKERKEREEEKKEQTNERK